MQTNMSMSITRLSKCRTERLRSPHTQREPDVILWHWLLTRTLYLLLYQCLKLRILNLERHYITSYCITLHWPPELSAALWSHICPLWEVSAAPEDRQQIVHWDRVAVFQTRPWESNPLTVFNRTSKEEFWFLNSENKHTVSFCRTDKACGHLEVTLMQCIY